MTKDGWAPLETILCEKAKSTRQAAPLPAAAVGVQSLDEDEEKEQAVITGTNATRKRKASTDINQPD